METSNDGRRFLVPRHRRLSWDLMWFNRSVPLCSHDRICDLSKLAAARAEARQRISWPALFLKAYGQTARKFPELRQIWYRWPWAHIYQHPGSVGILTVHREHKGKPWVFWGRIPDPGELTLLEIQSRIDGFVNNPTRATFRDEIRLASLPTFLRRAIWGWNIGIATSGRARRLGTFFLSTLASRGVEIQALPSIQTGCLTYGPLDSAGKTRVALAYDHRVMDGALVADILRELEMRLSDSLRDEVLQLPAPSDTMQRVA